LLALPNSALQRTTLRIAAERPGVEAVEKVHLALGIWDLDGYCELWLIDRERAANALSVTLGNGNGTFAPGVNVPAEADPIRMAIGDLNGDGKVDLAVANLSNYTSLNVVNVLLGVGDGTFAPKVDYTTGAGTVSVAIGDLNGDGRPDLVTTNNTWDTVSVLLGASNGTFAPQVTYLAGASPASVAIRDFNGDGRLDVVVVNCNSPTVSVLLNSCL
jgi:hypothetical protein